MSQLIALGVGAVLSVVLVAGGVAAANSDPKPISDAKLFTYATN